MFDMSTTLLNAELQFFFIKVFRAACSISGVMSWYACRMFCFKSSLFIGLVSWNLLRIPMKKIKHGEVGATGRPRHWTSPANPTTREHRFNSQPRNTGKEPRGVVLLEPHILADF